MRAYARRPFVEVAPGRRPSQEIAMTKVTVGATAVFACVLCATSLSVRFGPEGKVWLAADTASAEIGRPLTATSVAGVHRRHARRAYRRGYYEYGANGAYNN